MTDPSGSRPTRALVIEPAISPLPTTHTSTRPPPASAGAPPAAAPAPLDRAAGGERRPGRPEATAAQDAGMVVGLTRQPQRRPRAGQDQPGARERERRARGTAA